mgnify:CR=1 FL=1
MRWVLALALLGCKDPMPTEPPHAKDLRWIHDLANQLCACRDNEACRDRVTMEYDRAGKPKDWVDKIEDPFAREEARLTQGRFAMCLFQ